ncbi:MAG: TlpA family protein disulfide reductase [Oleispira antarctica]|uniref:Thioredoxin-like protein n=1 Tax=Oleispira antarctica RB-8 TaxID=698738 RepID=R4YQS4_OLEAN|nr:TlpA family protein disulfide reductase [Oleispira antarctica]MBQ0794042.1 TlpA family protein disulfide reductase [Oleispira antarctica]CCK75613.1 thioredoxin-like protein [Oleispira antarctica RB-8]
MNAVKYALIIACFFLVACNPLSNTETQTVEANVDKSSGDAALKDIVLNNDIPKDYWAGQWRVINIWAEWCKPCWQEIPELNEFFVTQKNTQIKLLGFNFDELESTELVMLKEKMSIQFPILNQWPEVWTKPDIKGLPATVIISPDNLIIDILWGPQTVASLDKGIADAKGVVENSLKEGDE